MLTRRRHSLASDFQKIEGAVRNFPYRSYSPPLIAHLAIVDNDR